ncbi:MAG: HAD family phosphatase [Nanoarchaeota archaeon]
MIKAIIFDIGGVVVNNLGKEIRKEVNNKFFIKYYAKYNKMLDSGNITLAQLEEIYKKYANLNLRKIYIEAAKKSMINKKVKNLVFKLNKKYKVIYLSNTFKEHYIVRKRQGVYKGFLFGINSYKLRMRKPYIAIYKLTLRKLNLRPEECLFIDDRKDNIKTARKLKINSILFRNYFQLIKGLKSFKLI